MVGVLLIGSAVAVAFLAAAAARLPSLVSTLLVAYLAFFANLGLVTLALSPMQWVTRPGLAIAQTILLAAALAAWWARGRPGLPLGPARAAAREVVSDPVTALFLAAVVIVLAYELVLALFVPANNGDSLSYHLAKAAAWAQHGGIYWIPDAPTVRINAFQPLAEQQILFYFVATGSGALFALPQYLAELAILVAVYGSARRLGFAVRASACSAFLVATFSLVALEATTAQNDLVAASFPAVAACLLLGRGAGLLEPALAGAAAGTGLGVKLTTALVLPVLLWLALAAGRRALAAALAGVVAALAAIGMWGYVLNLTNTGEVLGAGTSDVLNRGSPSYPGSVANAFYLVYGMMDASVLSSRLIHALALAGLAAGIAAAAWSLLHRPGLRRGIADGAAVATPLVAPLLVIGAAGAVAYFARLWGFPIRGPGGWVDELNVVLNREYTRLAHHSFSAFGPIGIVSLLAAVGLTIWAWARRRVDQRHLALASALPIFLILISLTTRWNPFLVRFFLVPAVLTAPLVAWLFVTRAATAAYLVVAAITVGLTVTEDITKPLESRGDFGPPWGLTRVEALYTNSLGGSAEALEALDELVPADACVGAVLDGWEPSYIIFGARHGRHVVYLSPGGDPLLQAVRNRLFHVVVSTGVTGGPEFAAALEAAGWRARPLGGTWILVSDPNAGTAACAP